MHAGCLAGRCAMSVHQSESARGYLAPPRRNLTVKIQGSCGLAAKANQSTPLPGLKSLPLIWKHPNSWAGLQDQDSPNSGHFPNVFLCSDFLFYYENFKRKMELVQWICSTLHPESTVNILPCALLCCWTIWKDVKDTPWHISAQDLSGHLLRMNRSPGWPPHHSHT